MSTDRGEVCRIAVVGPTSQIDLSLPTHVPLSDLMPALLGELGPDLADRGLAHSGWIAQRLGGPALDETRTVADLELLDGDVLHVRPRTDQIPPLDYDDLIDGVSAGIRTRSGVWRSQTARSAALLLLAAWLGTGLVAAQLWPDRPGRTMVLATAVLLCSAAGFAVARGRADRAAAGILGGAAVTGSVLAAADAVLVAMDAATPTVSQVGAPGAAVSHPDWLLPGLILAAAGAGTVAALLVAAFVFPRTGWRQIAAGLLLLWLLIAGAVGLRLQSGLDWPAVAAVVVVVTTALRPAVPIVAFKLAGLSLPDMPAEPEHLQENIEPNDSAQILAGAALADQSMTALYTGLGLVSGAAMVWLAVTPGWAAPLAAWLTAAAQVLATRAMTSTWHRAALAGPALLAMATWCLTATAARGPATAAAALSVCLVLALACGAVARARATHRFNPFWGRSGDWAHSLAVVALLPTVVLITGGVELIRAQVG